MKTKISLTALTMQILQNHHNSTTQQIIKVERDIHGFTWMTDSICRRLRARGLAENGETVPWVNHKRRLKTWRLTQKGLALETLRIGTCRSLPEAAIKEWLRNAKNRRHSKISD